MTVTEGTGTRGTGTRGTGTRGTGTRDMGPPLEVRSQHGSVTATVSLDPAVFGVQPNVPVLHQVVTAQLAAARAGTQSTKTRAEVSGGGAKPYRQKGTGRARQGSTRRPSLRRRRRGPGAKTAQLRQRTPRKMVQLALRGALSDRAARGPGGSGGELGLGSPEHQRRSAALTTLGLTGRVLVVLAREDERAYKSFRNLPASTWSSSPSSMLTMCCARTGSFSPGPRCRQQHMGRGPRRRRHCDGESRL